MNWAVIMAGGNGTRFWPLSNDSHPKQFLKLIGDRSPAQTCIDRLMHFIEADHILIVASEHHRHAVETGLPGFPMTQILWEPIGRNTAPCIAWACEWIRQRDAHAIIGVFPSDHDISDEESFAQCAKRAYKTAPGHIVLFGIEPTRPETGYGYIEAGKTIDADDAVYHVSAFREKPDRETAQKYLAEGNFLWNSGMFIFDAQTMHDELNAHVPQIAKGIEEIVSGVVDLETGFQNLLSISIDYAVMEHTSRALVIRATFPWDDLGTWESIARYYPRDANQNAIKGKAIVVDCNNTFVFADDNRPVGVLGLSNIVVVTSHDGTLVMDAARSQDVRQIADLSKFII